ncbi:hypothetical protein EMGBS15_01060 [Filimonas sp.]|nr:hypothetical protein EMGBS15_01060 [Filimonas sp.]
MLGSCVKTVSMPAATNRIIISVEGIANGVYSYKYDIDGKKVSTGKFTKE